MQCCECEKEFDNGEVVIYTDEGILCVLCSGKDI